MNDKGTINIKSFPPSQEVPNSGQTFTFERIISHRRGTGKRKGRLDVAVKWKDYEEPTWEPMEVIKQDDPITLAQYARQKGLLNSQNWRWARAYLQQNEMEPNDIDEEEIGVASSQDDDNDIVEDASSEGESSDSSIYMPKRKIYRKKHKRKYIYKDFVFYINDKGPSSVKLAKAFHAEVIQQTKDVDARGSDASAFMPPPQNMVQVLKLKNFKIKKAWIASCGKEITTLIENDTFGFEDPPSGTKVIPVMEDLRVKILEDGMLDKLKVRIVVRGDLQKKLLEDINNWSPTASHRSLKLFLANACKYKCRVRQLDFIGAYLQALMQTDVWIILPSYYASLFPKYKEYFGRPLKLKKSMYGQNVSGKNWYDELHQYLTSVGFIPSPSCPSMYVRRNKDGSMIKLLNYVDDMLYFCTNEEELKKFELDLAQRFRLELKGQASWYLSVRIQQDKNFDITIDQNRYVQSILRRFLDTARVPETQRHFFTPLPADFKASRKDLAPTEEESKEIQRQYNIDYPACVGCLIYLSYTRTDILYAVNKLAKFNRQPGRFHMDSIVHLLRYIRDSPSFGIKYYSDYEQSPVHKMLKQNGINTNRELVTFSDSSWQDDPDNSKSTGCYLNIYRGGLIDHSSNMPDPVALSSAEAEYNEGCLACMGTAHIKMLLEDLEQMELDYPIPIIIDSKAAHDMGHSFKSTKHTRHILRRYHYVREGQLTGEHELTWIPKLYQLADIGTKPVNRLDLQNRLQYLFVKLNHERKEE